MDLKFLPSGEGFEDFCFRTFKSSLHGDLFPYSLRETYQLVYTSWDEAVKELLESGIEGFCYRISPGGDDYLLSFFGFTHYVVMKDKSLKLLASFCNVSYRQQMSIFDIPVHYETTYEKKADGKMRIIQVPVDGYSPNAQDPRYLAFMESSGDLYAKTCFDRFIQDSGLTRCTAEIAETFGMPEEGLLCILKQNGIIVVSEDDEDGWEIAEALKDSGLTLVKTGRDGKPETQWTYKGGYFVWLLLTRDCKVRPRCERISH